MKKNLDDLYRQSSELANNGMLGKLSGIDLVARDQIFQKANQKKKEKLTLLIEEFSQKGNKEANVIDASDLSGVNNGDIYHYDQIEKKW